MDLVFERTDGLSCSEFLYKAVAKHYVKNYELGLIDSWSFGYDPETKFPSSNSDGREENLEKYHGLRIKRKQIEGKKNIKEQIEALIANKEVCMISADLFWIPWEPICYRNRHWQHAILITDIVATGYVCHDYYSIEGSILPFDHLPNKIDLATFEVVEPTERLQTIEDVTEVLHRTLVKNLIECNAFVKMLDFAEIFNDTFDICKATADSEVFENSRLINSVNRVAQCRFQFAIALDYLNERFPQSYFTVFSKGLRKCAVAWKSIMSLLIKAYLTSNNENIINKVHNKIIDAKIAEETICKELMETLQLRQYSKGIEETISMRFDKYHFCDLTDLFNHKAFGDEINRQYACYEQNCFMKIDKTTPSRELCCSELRFKLGNLAELTFDNIICAKQIIKIEQVCRAVMIMSNAEYDHQIDKIIIHTDSGDIVQEISTTSWHSTPVLNDTIMWNGCGCVSTNSGIHILPGAKSIFGKTYNLQKEEYITSIELPENPNIHIFAITVCQ